MAVINPKNINVGFDELHTVIHISDIHIRLYRRHKEYRTVFKTLYSDIKAKQYKNAVIAVTGDILHAKTDLSPEMIQLTSEFLNNLANIHPTFVFIGNHDLNLANSYRLDSLTPILKNIANPNLYYPRDSGIYRIADTDFAVFSVIGDMSQWPEASECTSDTKLAIVHAPVNDSKTDTGYTITSRHLDTSTFDGYDFVLLGDIHRRQVLQEKDKAEGKPLIAYAGSLIQQNHGENLEGHGWLEWDLKKSKITPYDTYNDYGYATIVVDDTGHLPDLSGIPPKARIRVFVKDLELSKLKKIESILKKRFKIQELTINKMRDGNLTIDNQRQSAQMLNVQDLEVQNKLIGDYLDRHHAITDDGIMKRIYEINGELNSQLEPEDFSRNVHWKPIRFEFDNILSYGEDNVIDFDTMHGVYGLFSPNASGKTAAFDALTFCLFDKTPRAFKGSHIMNNRKKKFRAYLHFEINGIEYGVVRVGKRRGTSVKVDVDFWKMENGVKISLNAEDRRSTNAVIRKYVGTYDDFILTSFSVQNNNALFIDKSQSERKDLLSQFMGINIFDALYTRALDEMKENKGALRVLKKTDISAELVTAQTEIEKLSAENKDANAEIRTKRSENDKLDAEILELHGKKAPLPPVETDIGKLESFRDTVAIEIDNLSEEIVDFDTRIQTAMEESGSLTKTVSRKASKEIETRYNQYEQLQSQLKINVTMAKATDTAIESDRHHIEHFTTHEFDPNCTFCVKNNQKQVKKLKEIEKSLLGKERKKSELDVNRAKIESQLTELDGIESEYGAYRELSTKLQNLELDLLTLKAKRSECKTKLEVKKSKQAKTKEQIAQYYKLVDLIEKNSEIDELIGELQQDQETIQSEIKALESRLRSLHGKLQVQKSHKTALLKKIEDMEEIEQDLRAYEYYVDAVKRNGIPYELISKVIPSIQSEINNILSQIVDFTITLEIDGKNINGRISYGDDRRWPLEMSSGMERFISSLAIRVALIAVSNLPKPNFLIVDEGLGTLSSENLMSMHMLFSILKNQFDFIVIISHLDVVRDMVDGLMEIELDGGYSRINY